MQYTHPAPDRETRLALVNLCFWWNLGNFLANLSRRTVSLRPSAHGATHKKLIGHANYQPVSSESLPMLCNGMPHTALPVSNPLVARHKLVPSDSASQSPSYFSLQLTVRLHDE